jgi:CubicO group peptidase (beta-lactamase class C family)
MTPGWDWQEMGAWGGLPTPMTDSPDWVRYVLSRPMKHKPGKRMCYDSGSSHLLSAILQATTGLSSAEYARRHLFEPIGIERFRWGSDTNGIVIGGFGLELAPPDLAKLGQLMLNRGLWQGRRIVSEDWIAASTSARYHTYDHIGSYGYHWWVLPQDEESDRPAVYFAMGYGGQYLFIVPRLELVVVFASTLYKRTFFPYRLFKKWLNLEEDKPSALLSKR